jgi:AcrR family transcriptional regulator
VIDRGERVSPHAAPGLAALREDRPDVRSAEVSDPLIKVNKSGQLLGQKGHRTRMRIVAATLSLIEVSHGLAPSAAAVARAAEISSPTFYLYFADVGEAILAAVEQIGDELDPVIALLEPDWPAEALFDHARAFVDAYFDYWEAHASALRVRNRLADQGDQRFVTLRVDSVGRLSNAIADKLVVPESGGKIVVGRQHLASVLVTALERSATVRVLGLYPDSARERAGTMDALALLIARSMQP